MAPFSMQSLLYVRPVVPLLLAFMSGIAVGTETECLSIWAYLILLITALRIFFLIWNRKKARFSPVLLFLAIGYLAIQPWAFPRLPTHHISRFIDGAHWNVVGVVASRPVSASRYTKFILEVESLQRHSQTLSAVGKLRLTASNPTIDLDKGDRITFSSSLRSIRNFQNPGGFDYKRHMAFKGVWVSAYTKGFRLARVERETDNPLMHWVAKARRAVALLVEKSATGEHQSVLKALLIGDRGQITPALRDIFHRTGTGHLLAISGLHVGIVAAAAFYLFSWVLSRFKIVLWSAWSRKGAALLSMIPATAYAILAGMSPSTQRALVMVSVYLMTFVFEKEHDLFNTLAIAALLILVISPPAFWSISFQLSFLSVLTIIYGVVHLTGADTVEVEGKWFKIVKVCRHKMLVFVMISVYATLGTLPIVMMHFNQVSLVGFITNVIFVPIIGFLVVPAGLLCVLLLPFSEAIALGGIEICGFVLKHALGILQWIANLPFAAVKTITPSAVESICYYALLWLVMHVTHKMVQKPLMSKKPTIENESSAHPKSRLFELPHISLTRLKVTMMVLVIAVLLIDIHYWLYQRHWRQDMVITILDVGNGNAALLELPEGQCVLIDGGGFSDNSAFDMGARVIAPFLWRKKIKTVDTLVLSHPNSDHLNGLLYIAEHFNVKTVWSNNENRNTAGYKQFKRIIQKKNITLVNFEEMPQRQQINGVYFDILYPPKDFLLKRAGQPWRNTNNNSLVVKVTMGVHSVLFPGDVMAVAENELVSRVGANLSSTVLIVPHHGSNSSSTNSFIKEVNARYAIISSRFGIRYKFPHPSVLERLRQHNCKIFRTDEVGAVIIHIDGRKMTLRVPLTRRQIVENL